MKDAVYANQNSLGIDYAAKYLAMNVTATIIHSEFIDLFNQFFCWKFPKLPTSPASLYLSVNLALDMVASRHVNASP